MMKFFVLILCLLVGSSLYAQENTILGTGALSQATSPKYAIQTIQINSPGSYTRPTIDMGNHTVQWEYQYIGVDQNGLYVDGYFSSTTDLGSFIPSVVGGHGTGATLNIYLSWFDGVNYFYGIYSDNQGSGYVPQVTLSTSTGTNYQIYAYIDENNEFHIDYHDYTKTNLYTTAPTVSVSFGGATATAILEGTAANAQNTAIGYQALYSTIASDNVAVGNKAGYELTTGKKNTLIGSEAGKGLTTGSGNTIIGSTSSNLPANLSNSVLLADGNGSTRMYFTPNGNALVGYGTNFTDNGYRLDVNGNARVNGIVFAPDIDSYQATAITANKMIEASSNNIRKLHSLPTSNTYTDALAFNRKGYQISYQESTDKLNFTQAVVNMNLFSGKKGTNSQIEVINGTTVKAARWTWGGTMYSNAQWLALDFGWCSGTTIGVKVEHSADNVNWQTNHVSSYYVSSSGISRYHYISYMDESNYFRLTITHMGGNVVRLSSIRLLTTRLGNQGAAPEYAYPYTWNKDGWIGINKGVVEPEYPLDVNGTSRLSGTMLLSEPITSTGNFDFLTRNVSTGAIEKVGGKMHKAVEWIAAPGADANTIEENTSSFTYSNNAPVTGPLTHFGNTGYGLQLNAAYSGASSLYFRTRNGDGNWGWNNWKRLLFEDSSSNWDINISGSSSKWNNNTFNAGEVASPAYFVTGNGGSSWGYSSGNQLKTALGLPTSGGFDLQGSTGRGNVTTNNIIAQSFGIRYSDGSTYQTIGTDHTGLGTLYRSFITGGDVPVHRFRGSEAVDLLVIKNGGNVGIGIENPLEKLAVNGKIRAREVKVEPMNGWPDYVFEETYKPKTLKEIEAFIKFNKHLPEVPSAKEVEKNGVELGEMNKILLKKIEELTLLLIEQNKRIEDLEKKNNQR